MKSANIVLATRSCFKYGLAKYVEAAMAGAIVAGDAPAEPSVDYAALGLVELTDEMTDDEIVATLDRWLADEEGRRARARAARRAALARLTWMHTAKAVIAAAALFRAKAFGAHRAS